MNSIGFRFYNGLGWMDDGGFERLLWLRGQLLGLHLVRVWSCIILVFCQLGSSMEGIPVYCFGD